MLLGMVSRTQLATIRTSFWRSYSYQHCCFGVFVGRGFSGLEVNFFLRVVTQGYTVQRVFQFFFQDFLDF